MGIDYGLVLTQRKENVMNQEIVANLKVTAQYLLDNHVNQFREYGYWTCCELIERTVENFNYPTYQVNAIDLHIRMLRNGFIDKFMSHLPVTKSFFLTEYTTIVTESVPTSPIYKQKLQEIRIEWLQFIINYGA